MTILKTVIVDDESKSSDILVYMINEYFPEISIAKVFNDPFEAVSYLKTNSVDLLFLDIQMPELDGFELLDQLNEIEFSVVFISAYDKYALKAFKYYALDYIMKPVDVDELRNLLDRISQLNFPKYNKSDFDQIFERVKSISSPAEQVAIPTQTGIVFLLFDDIVRLKADSNYTFVIRSDGSKVYAAKTLKYFENLLPSDTFYRPHHSHIINIKYMDEFIRVDGGFIKMRDGELIGLSRSKRQEFMNRFKS